MSDRINHPSHYTAGDVECIDAIKAALGPELYCGYLWGNAIKYLWRWARKNLDEDLEKCKWHIGRMQREGYTTPARYDSDSGCMVPNPALAMVNCGVSMADISEPTGEHSRFAW